MARWREPIAPLRVLLACGSLSEAEARDPRVRVSTSSSSHLVVKVVAPGGQAFVVKQVPRAAAEAGRSLRQEMFVYRLARLVDALAAALPTPVHIDEARQVVVVDAVDGADTWPPTRWTQPGVAERLATLMAAWHRATMETGLWPSPALGILELPDSLDLASAGRPQATRRLMAAIAGDDTLAAALRTARSAWQDRCLIHGDLRRENLLTHPSRDPAHVTVIDWELSGSGDPAWDLAGVLAEIAIEAVRAGRVSGGGRATQQMDVGRGFVSTYAARGGLIDGSSGPDAWAHVVRCTAARLLHVACEWAEMQVDDQADVRADLQGDRQDDPTSPLVDEARGLLGRVGAVAGDWQRWAQS